MAPKKRPANIDASRLSVLAAAGDDRAFLAHALELLDSGGRLQREAALDALVEHPTPAAREPVRRLYFELDADGLKRDQGARMRVAITRILHTLGDLRDRDIGIRAADTHEVAFGDDISWNLRVHGLMLLARIAREVFPYYAVEHLDDTAGIDGEPANSAFQLLAGTGNHVALYQWLLSGERPTQLVLGVLELLREAPREIVPRYVSGALETALRRSDEALITVLAENVVSAEMDANYQSIATIMSAKISDELYNYLAVLLASTNRAPLLAILEQQLHGGRRSKLILDALRVRTTDEQAAILQRWEERAD